MVRSVPIQAILWIIAIKYLVRVVKLVVLEILFLSYLLISWWVTCNGIRKTVHEGSVCAQKGSWKLVSPHKNQRKLQRASRGMMVWIGCRECAIADIIWQHLLHCWKVMTVTCPWLTSRTSLSAGTVVHVNSAHPAFLTLLSKISSFRQHQMTYIILWWRILVNFFCYLSLSIVSLSWLYATSSQAALDVK